MAVTIQDGKFYFNGVRQEFALGRSSFKLANIVTYHYTGKGGGDYSLGAALRWVEHNQRIFGENVVLRVFLETGGWDPKSQAMFGSPPSDQGFWNRDRLRDRVREANMHRVGERVLEWFFQTSADTGVAFELVIDATLKHDNIPAGEIDHVIRQVGIRMGELSLDYPDALIIPNVRNEWNAHNQNYTDLRDVNMWATRWWRDGYWPNAPLIVDPGGGDTFTYDVGMGGYRAAMIHPDRGDGWETAPERLERGLRQKSGGLPIGFTESMYLVEKEDLRRVLKWYRPSGWTADFEKYEVFLASAKRHLDYFIIHDEKGVQCDVNWPRPMTRIERHFADKLPKPEPEPEPESQLDRIESKIDMLLAG